MVQKMTKSLNRFQEFFFREILTFFPTLAQFTGNSGLLSKCADFRGPKKRKNGTTFRQKKGSKSGSKSDIFCSKRVHFWPLFYHFFHVFSWFLAKIGFLGPWFWDGQKSSKIKSWKNHFFKKSKICDFSWNFFSFFSKT